MGGTENEESHPLRPDTRSAGALGFMPCGKRVRSCRTAADPGAHRRTAQGEVRVNDVKGSRPAGRTTGSRADHSGCSASSLCTAGPERPGFHRLVHDPRDRRERPALAGHDEVTETSGASHRPLRAASLRIELAGTGPGRHGAFSIAWDHGRLLYGRATSSSAIVSPESGSTGPVRTRPAPHTPRSR